MKYFFFTFETTPVATIINQALNVEMEEPHTHTAKEFLGKRVKVLIQGVKVLDSTLFFFGSKKMRHELIVKCEILNFIMTRIK